MGLIYACWDESKGQKDLNLTEETIKVYDQMFLYSTTIGAVFPH